MQEDIDELTPVKCTMSSSSEVIQARRTESLDAPDILKLVSATTDKLFGRVNVVNIIEKANLAVTLENDQNEVIAHAAFFDFLNFPGVEQSEWEHWLSSKYKCNKANPLNSLFMNYFVAKPDYAYGCATEIIRTVFNAVPFLHYIFLVVPKAVDTGPALSEIFHPMQYHKDFNGSLSSEVQVCHRHEHCPTLHIRAARVEDHDDLTPIFNRQSDVLSTIYGDFFLSEFIEAQDDINKCVVADVNGTAVGFMSICSEVNVGLLDKCFDLRPFNGLCRLSNKQHSPQQQKKDEGTDVSEERSPSQIEGAPSTQGSENSDTKKPTPEEDEAKDHFEGEECAFCIQLFCIDELYEMRSADFLSTLFELFPDKDYCVLTMPHLVPEFPLLQSFTRVTPKKHSTLSQELYVFHKWGLLGSFTVRPCTCSDLQGVEKLVSRLDGGDAILSDMKQYSAARRDPDGTELQMFIAESVGQVVGAAVLRREEDIEYIRSHYNIEDFIYFNHHQRNEHAHLHHFILNPVFQQYSKHFLKEVLRLAHKSCLYYPIYPPYTELKETKPHTRVTALNDMVPIKARRQIIYPLDHLGINAPSQRILANKEHYALTHLNRKLTLEPKVTINARIVVVGASDVGISFLETLVFCPHLRFNNLTLISTDGLPGQLAPCSLRSRCLPSSLCYLQEDLVHMALQTWLSVVKGTMVALDRTNMQVKLIGGGSVPYDYLVLCTGQQFQIAVPTGADISTLVTTSEVPLRQPPVYQGPMPPTVFTVNTDSDCEKIVSWTKEQFLHSSGTALVYGSSLEAYTMVEMLLTAGVSGSRIVIVHPPTCGPTCFNNPDIDAAVKERLTKLGVLLQEGHTLAQWNDADMSVPLFCATFTSESKPLRVECQAFFCFQEKRVDYQAFKAINDSCLVFDGKLVVDADFHTNDPRIRAGGPLTKYQRRYHAESWTHANFNSKEVGAQLAQSMLRNFDPTIDDALPDGASENQGTVITMYKKPKVVTATLPGGYSYLHVGKPGLNLPLDSQMVQPEYGRELVTGSAKDIGDGAAYFRLHVNQYSAVETITCHTPQQLDTSNISCLYGLHERSLNNLLQRFDEGLIKDFYSFFRESWCLAVFHDRFTDFREEVRELLVAKPAADVHSLEEKVRKMIEEDLVLSKDQRSILTDSYVASSAKKAIEQRLLGFLSYNSYHLPMYSKPGVV